jgi:hypothetical protein
VEGIGGRGRGGGGRWELGREREELEEIRSVFVSRALFLAPDYLST